MWPCKSEPSKKLIALSLVCGWSQYIQLEGSLRKRLERVINLLFVQILLVQICFFLYSVLQKFWFFQLWLLKISFPFCLTTFLICFRQLETLAICEWHLNLGFSTNWVWYLVLSNKNLFKWQKAKMDFLLWSTFSLDNWWDIKFLTEQLWSGCPFSIFVMN